MLISRLLITLAVNKRKLYYKIVYIHMGRYRAPITVHCGRNENQSGSRGFGYHDPSCEVSPPVVVTSYVLDF